MNAIARQLQCWGKYVLGHITLLRVMMLRPILNPKVAGYDSRVLVLVQNYPLQRKFSSTQFFCNHQYQAIVA